MGAPKKEASPKKEAAPKKEASPKKGPAPKKEAAPKKQAAAKKEAKKDAGNEAAGDDKAKEKKLPKCSRREANGVLKLKEQQTWEVCNSFAVLLTSLKVTLICWLKV